MKIKNYYFLVIYYIMRITQPLLQGKIYFTPHSHLVLWLHGKQQKHDGQPQQPRSVQQPAPHRRGGGGVHRG